MFIISKREFNKNDRPYWRTALAVLLRLRDGRKFNAVIKPFYEEADKFLLELEKDLDAVDVEDDVDAEH